MVHFITQKLMFLLTFCPFVPFLHGWITNALACAFPFREGRGEGEKTLPPDGVI